MCFSYPADVQPGARKRDVAQPISPELRSMPYPCFSYSKLCFSYPPDASLSVRNRDAAQPPLPGLRRMPQMCFRY
jgi:hypothetical protein